MIIITASGSRRLVITAEQLAVEAGQGVTLSKMEEFLRFRGYTRTGQKGSHVKWTSPDGTRNTTVVVHDSNKKNTILYPQQVKNILNGMNVEMPEFRQWLANNRR